LRFSQPAMAAKLAQKKRAFFSSHVLPALFVFLIPAFSAWFFSFAEARSDRSALAQVEGLIARSKNIPDADKPKLVDYYRRHPVSEILASDNPKTAASRTLFAPAKTRYAVLRWMKRIAWICLGTIVATFVVVGLSVAVSLRSQSAQYYALRVGWPVLRTSAAIQVLGQGALAVALSFWVTVILTESYYMKLILMISLLALAAVVALLKAVFAKLDDRFEVNGEMVSEMDAASLWSRVREIAARLNTPAPDRIVVGVVPSFFVTEHPVTVGSEVHHGRTLYLSLPMLKVLAVDEADAVLGHELAHFSGQDTLWSEKISPLTQKFALYLEALANGMSLIVAHFMHVFWKLYGLSIRRLSRVREFRADRIGADLVSADAMKRALIKITCYCEYRAKTEEGIFEKLRVDRELNLPMQLEQGYPAFLSGFAENGESIQERVPHPFDTHPTLTNRLAQLGFEPQTALHDPELREPAANSWYHAIASAPDLEQRLWTERQQALQSLHSVTLAWRLMPTDEEQMAVVREHFPPVVFRKKDGSEATLEFDRIQLPGSATPIFFDDIVHVVLDDSWGQKRLTLFHKQEGKRKHARTRFYPAKFKGEKGDLLAGFSHYFSRHKTAEAATELAAA
jgi:Zn-dependent protease with chaperone function